PQTDAVLARSVMPRGIRLSRMFDLEHVRAEIAEERRGERTREQRRDLDDLETGERVSGRRGERVAYRLGHISDLPGSNAQRNPIADERSIDGPARRSFSETSGGCGPPSAYHSDPSRSMCEPPLRMVKRVRPSLCSLSVQFHTRGVPRANSGYPAATCHSNSVGRRAPAHFA